MKAEFFKDANGKIWFFYARGIQTRNCPTKVRTCEEAKKEAKNTEKNKRAVRQQMIDELEAYEAQMRADNKKEKRATVDKMKETMNQYYNNLKKEANPRLAQTGQDDEDDELDRILKTLKPNTTAKNFKEFLKREDNCLKS